MKGYLLDTDICIFFLKDKFHLTEKIDAVGIDKCFISAITIGELLYGAEFSSDYEKHIKEVVFFEDEFTVIPVYEALRIYAKEKARLRRLGTMIADLDLLIGATAITHDLIMVTRNYKHFSKIDSIQLEDWTEKEYNEFVI
ncbi:MAG: type II toxin-antitoxin system VapC family toxin [Chitinophagales bacterium]